LPGLRHSEQADRRPHSEAGRPAAQPGRWRSRAARASHGRPGRAHRRRAAAWPEARAAARSAARSTRNSTRT